MRHQDVGDDGEDVVGGTGDDHRLHPQSGRGDLGDQRVADGPDGAVVDKC